MTTFFRVKYTAENLMKMQIWFKVFTGKKQRQVGQSIPEWTKLILWMKAFKKFEAEFT